VNTRIGTLEFTHDFANGYPTKETIEKLYDERDFQRACQAYLWAIPAVSFAEWQVGHASFGAGNGDIAALLDYDDRLGVLTPNATTPYCIVFADLTSGRRDSHHRHGSERGRGTARAVPGLSI
jgi:hypothetical protein